jgi:hypothetical protein
MVVADDRQQIIEEFDEAVNMTPKELEEWLQTEESKSVGQSDGGGESKGHESGRRIVEIIAVCSDIGPLLLAKSGVGMSGILKPPELCLKANAAGVVQLH